MKTCAPILLPGSEVRFSARASPFVWGFQDPGSGAYGFILEKVILANGRAFSDEFSERSRRDAELMRRQEAITELRLKHGAVHSEILRLKR